MPMASSPNSRKSHERGQGTGEIKMIQIKKLKRPSKRSGKKLMPNEESEQKAFGVVIINIGTKPVYVDRVKEIRRK